MRNRLRTCRSTAAISWIWRSWNRAFKSRTERTSGKDGYSSISIGGRFGRTARIEVDGVDVSDEIFGSTTMNIPASGIQEFQLSQSSLDLSTELTTSGAVNVTTRSGTNEIHGEAFGFFRDSSLAAALPAPPGLSEPFQRSQYGGASGWADYQKQVLLFSGCGTHATAFASTRAGSASLRSSIPAAFSAPFTETNLLAKGGFPARPLTARLLSIRLL